MVTSTRLQDTIDHIDSSPLHLLHVACLHDATNTRNNSYHQTTGCSPAPTLSKLPLSPLLSMPLRLLPINKVQPLRLDLPINKSTNKTGNDLLGLGMVIDLA